MEDLEVLKNQGFTFKKHYGQNFLTDKNLLDAIARDAAADGETVLEIGAGAGALTRALASRAKRVVAYEIDKNLKGVLSVTLSDFKNVEVLFRDFTKENMQTLEKQLGKYIVCANLPYYVTTPVVMKFVEESKSCRKLTLMVQEEVARRFCAKENTPEYGAVTAAIARRGEAQFLRKVPRELFVPHPNVDSAVIKIDFERGGFSVENEEFYRRTVRCAFLSRRKTLENNLMNVFRVDRTTARELLREAQIEENLRGEALSPRRLGRLSDMIFAKFNGEN